MGYRLSLSDRIFYAVAIRLYEVCYYCFDCHANYRIRGAMPRRKYFCPDCSMELLKGTA